MKYILSTLLLFGTTMGFADNRFATDAERQIDALELLIDANYQGLQELKEIVSYQRSMLLKLNQIYDVVRNYQLEDHLQLQKPQADNLKP